MDCATSEPDVDNDPFPEEEANYDPPTSPVDSTVAATPTPQKGSEDEAPAASASPEPRHTVETKQKCAATPAALAAAATDNNQMPSALAAAAPAAPPLEASSTGSTCSTLSMTATAAPEPPQNQSMAQALSQNTSQVPVPPPQDAAPPSTTQDDDDARQQAKKVRVEAIDVKLSQSGSEDEAPGQPQIPEPPLQDPAPPQGSALAESLTKHLRQNASPQDKPCQAPALITIEPSPHGVTKSFPPPELSNRAASPEIGTKSRTRKNLDGWYVGRAGGLEPPLRKMLG